jgi:amylosucrase
LGFVRIHKSHRVVVIANFADSPQQLSGNALRTAGMGRFFEDVITGKTYASSENVELQPYQTVWLNRV